jgi:ribosomal protein L11
MSYQNYGLGLGNSQGSNSAAESIDKAEEDLIRQINELANEDCNSSELKRMRKMILGEEAHDPSDNNSL